MVFNKNRNTLVIVTGVITLIGLILLIVGIVLIAKAKEKSSEDCNAGVSGASSGEDANRCSYSEEAKRAGVDKFLQKVQDTYYDLHPQDLIFKPGGVKNEELMTKFKPYNPEPKNMKKITDKARQLLNELDDLGVNTLRLKPREKKAVAQLKHYLQNNFGKPYDSDYYAGDFLMGPNLFCWQEICSVGSSDIRYGLGNFHPKNLDDVRLFLSKMELVAATFSTYVNNLRLGIKAGMVRSVEECKAGIDAFKRNYLQVSLQGEQGMWNELTKWEVALTDMFGRPRLAVFFKISFIAVIW